jgi:hypothetical protein
MPATNSLPLDPQSRPRTPIRVGASRGRFGGKKMNSRDLKKHLKYIVPEMRLALIKESGANPLPVNCPEDLEKFV